MFTFVAVIFDVYYIPKIKTYEKDLIFDNSLLSLFGRNDSGTSDESSRLGEICQTEVWRQVARDKNESLTYQQVIEAPGKTKQQLYVALNYWTTATFKDNSAITLNDKEAGCIIISSTIKNIAEHMGTFNKYSVSITPVIRLDIKEGKIRITYTVQTYDVLADISGGWLSPSDDSRKTYGDSKRKADDKTNANLYDEQWEIARHYPFVEKDAQKRTCAKALVMTHAYSNAIIDKVEEAVKNGIVGNDDDDW